MDTLLSSPIVPAVIRCHVATHAALRATPEMLTEWRRQPPPVAGQPLPASHLKHSDDQTITALAAVHAANLAAHWSGRSFSDWGVVAAANFMGRSGTANSSQRYALEGAWGVSPHIIPHQSLHAVSGTVSQLLKIHGPNFGISGGAQAGQDAFLIAAALLAEGTVPGLWLLLSGHDREYIPAENGTVADPARVPRCEAVALALMPDSAANSAAATGMYLRIGADANRAGLREWNLSALVEALVGDAGPVGATWRTPGAGWLELEVMALGAGSRR